MAEAREALIQVKKWIKEGIDPSEQKKAQSEPTQAPEVITFEKIAREWLEHKTNNLTTKYRSQVQSRVENYLIPAIGQIPIADLRGRDILPCLREHEARGHIETAHRLAGIVSQICRYAVVLGHCEFDAAGQLGSALSTRDPKNRAAILDPTEIGTLLRAIDSYKGDISTRYALKIVPYVFLRNTELRCAHWEEIDLDNALWTVPAERMKKKREHLVPLATQVVTLFRSWGVWAERFAEGAEDGGNVHGSREVLRQSAGVRADGAEDAGGLPRGREAGRQGAAMGAGSAGCPCWTCRSACGRRRCARRRFGSTRRPCSSCRPGTGMPSGMPWRRMRRPARSRRLEPRSSTCPGRRRAGPEPSPRVRDGRAGAPCGRQPERAGGAGCLRRRRRRRETADGRMRRTDSALPPPEDVSPSIGNSGFLFLENLKQRQPGKCIGGVGNGGQHLLLAPAQRLYCIECLAVGRLWRLYRFNGKFD